MQLLKALTEIWKTQVGQRKKGEALITALPRNTLTLENMSSQNYFRYLYQRVKFQCILTPSTLNSLPSELKLCNSPEIPLLHTDMLAPTFYFSLRSPQHLQVFLMSLSEGFHYPFTHLLHLSSPLVM